MADETLFDQAWEQWRRALTQALASPDTSPRTRQALAQAGALDPDDGLVDRTWAFALIAGGEPARQLAAHGLSDEEIDRLVALVRRHPTPAAGG